MEEEADVAELMGFGSFDSTKGQKKPDSVDIRKKRLTAAADRYCDLCRTQVPLGSEGWQIHIDGRRHKKKQATATAQKAPTAEGVNTEIRKRKHTAAIAVSAASTSATTAEESAPKLTKSTHISANVNVPSTTRTVLSQPPHRARKAAVACSRVVHLKGLSPDTSNEDLVQLCQQFGSLVNFIIIKTTDQALAEFSDLDSSKRLLEAAPLTLNGCAIFCQYSTKQMLVADNTRWLASYKARTMGDDNLQQALTTSAQVHPSPVVHLCNLPVDARDVDLHLLCNPFGHIVNYILIHGTDQALVQFESAREASEMVQQSPVAFRDSLSVYCQFSSKQKLSRLPTRKEASAAGKMVMQAAMAARSKEGRPSRCRVVQLSYLPPRVTQPDVHTLCRPHGAVLKLILMQEKNQALVEYDKVESAAELVNSSPITWRGAAVFARYSIHQALTSAGSQPKPQAELAEGEGKSSTAVNPPESIAVQIEGGFLCKLCDIVAPTHDALRLHFQTDSHKKAFASKHGVSAATFEDNFNAADIASVNSAQSQSGSSFDSAATMGQMAFICNLCRFKCFSYDEYASHRNSARHRRDAGRLDVGQQIQCSTCNWTSPYSANVHKQHVKSPQHCDNMKSFMQKIVSQSARPKRCVKLRGLPPATKTSDILRFLGDSLARRLGCGGDLRIGFDPQGRPTGEAFALFDDANEADSAARQLNARPLLVGGAWRVVTVETVTEDVFRLGCHTVPLSAAPRSIPTPPPAAARDAPPMQKPVASVVGQTRTEGQLLDDSVSSGDLSAKISRFLSKHPVESTAAQHFQPVQPMPVPVPMRQSMSPAPHDSSETDVLMAALTASSGAAGSDSVTDRLLESLIEKQKLEVAAGQRDKSDLLKLVVIENLLAVRRQRRTAQDRTTRLLEQLATQQAQEAAQVLQPPPAQPVATAPPQAQHQPLQQSGGQSDWLDYVLATVRQSTTTGSGSGQSLESQGLAGRAVTGPIAQSQHGLAPPSAGAPTTLHHRVERRVDDLMQSSKYSGRQSGKMPTARSVALELLSLEKRRKEHKERLARMQPDFTLPPPSPASSSSFFPMSQPAYRSLESQQLSGVLQDTDRRLSRVASPCPIPRPKAVPKIYPKEPPPPGSGGLGGELSVQDSPGAKQSVPPPWLVPEGGSSAQRTNERQLLEVPLQQASQGEPGTNRDTASPVVVAVVPTTAATDTVPDVRDGGHAMEPALTALATSEHADDVQVTCTVISIGDECKAEDLSRDEGKLRTIDEDYDEIQLVPMPPASPVEQTVAAVVHQNAPQPSSAIVDQQHSAKTAASSYTDGVPAATATVAPVTRPSMTPHQSVLQSMAPVPPPPVVQQPPLPVAIALHPHPPDRPPPETMPRAPACVPPPEARAEAAVQPPPEAAAIVQEDVLFYYRRRFEAGTVFDGVRVTAVDKELGDDGGLRFYLQLKADDNALAQITANAIGYHQVLQRSPSRLRRPAQTGTRCVALSSNGQLYRVEVLEDGEPTVGAVQFVDFGWRSPFAAARLWPLDGTAPACLSDAPALAVRCALDNFLPHSAHSVAARDFTELASTCQCVVLRMLADGAYSVRLIRPGGGSLSDMLVQLRLGYGFSSTGARQPPPVGTIGGYSAGLWPAGGPQQQTYNSAYMWQQANVGHIPSNYPAESSRQTQQAGGEYRHRPANCAAQAQRQAQEGKQDERRRPRRRAGGGSGGCSPPPRRSAAATTATSSSAAAAVRVAVARAPPPTTHRQQAATASSSATSAAKRKGEGARARPVNTSVDCGFSNKQPAARCQLPKKQRLDSGAATVHRGFNRRIYNTHRAILDSMFKSLEPKS